MWFRLPLIPGAPTRVIAVSLLLFSLCCDGSAFLPAPSSRQSPDQATYASAVRDLEFRAPKIADIDPISDLLVECFEGELKWFEFPERENRRQKYRQMLQSSFLRRIQPDDNNLELSFWLLAESRNDRKIVGFVQVGSLPPPPGFSTSLPNRTLPEAAEDVPYIANLCVLPSHRGTGIGQKLVAICLLWLDRRRRFDRVYIAVDKDNWGAKRFYERNQFQWIEPPSSPPGGIAVARRDYYYRDISGT